MRQRFKKIYVAFQLDDWRNIEKFHHKITFFDCNKRFRKKIKLRKFKSNGCTFFNTFIFIKE